MYLFQIAAQVVDQGETEHGAVGSGDKKRLGRRTAGDNPGGCRCRKPVYCRLGAAHQSVSQADPLIFKRFVVVVVAIGIGRQTIGITGVDDIIVKRGAEVGIVAHQADDSGGVIVERGKDSLVAVGPGRRHILERHAVKRLVIHGDFHRLGDLACIDLCGHLQQHRFRWRNTRNPVVDLHGLLARARLRNACRQTQAGNKKACAQPGE